MEVIEGRNKEVRELIEALQAMKMNNSSLLTTIANFDLVIEGLEELDSIVEMKETKKSIVSQIKFLLVNTVFDESKGNFDGHMLHTVISGGAGRGKTAVGTVLAKVWTGLGLIKSGVKEVKENKENKEHKTIPKSASITTDKIEDLDRQIQSLLASGKIKNNIVKKLQDRCAKIRETLRTRNLQNNIYKMKTLRREFVKNFSKPDVDILAYHNCITLLNEIIESEEYNKNQIDTLIDSRIREETVEFSITFPLAGPAGKVGDKIETKEKDEKTCIMDQIVRKIDKIEKMAIDKPVEKPIDKLSISQIGIDELAPKKFDIIRIVSREDFVAGYQGQSTLKTEKLLNDSLGKVLFIDEAYSLITDEKDSYGHECLTVLNRFMTQHANEIVVIFAGYTEFLENSIFKAQPGLKRRCTWFFNIEEYSPAGLSAIFSRQLARHSWLVDESIDLTKFFTTHRKLFKYDGGDTEKLAFFCKIHYANKVFSGDIENNKIVTEDILEKALEHLRTSEAPSSIPFGIYV